MMIDQDFQFLPLKRLTEMASRLHEDYARAEPYPHVVIDGLFDPALLARVIDEFPRTDDHAWHHYKNAREVKLEASRDEHFGPMTRLLLYHFNSAPFLAFLTQVTGIDGLIADSYYEGGGMHQIERGGKLAIHADFNKHSRTNLDRRLNVLLYLNEDWKDEYGGHFEMWNVAMDHCVRKVAPLNNRMVIFSTTEFSYHGHPDPLACPPMMTRKSLAIYYYTNGRPADELAAHHPTIFRARPGEALFGDTRGSLGDAVKKVAKDFLPPIVARSIKKIRSAGHDARRNV